MLFLVDSWRILSSHKLIINEIIVSIASKVEEHKVSYFVDFGKEGKVETTNNSKIASS